MAIEVEGMDEVEAWSGTVILGPGKHSVIIDRADEGQSKAGNPQVEIQFVSTEGLGEIRDWLTFPTDPVARESAKGRAKMLLEAIGIESKSGKWTFPTNELVGKKLEITVMEEPKFNDPTKKVSKVKGFSPLDQSDVPADTSGFGAANPDDLPF